MKAMNEQQFDMLIAETLERRHFVEEINKAVMCDIRRKARQRKLRYWRNAIAFSFGLPLSLFVFGVLFVKYVLSTTSEVYSTICLLIPVAAVLFAAYKAVCNFSADRSVINSDRIGLISEV